MEAGTAPKVADKTATERVYELIGAARELPFAVLGGAALLLIPILMLIFEGGLPDGGVAIAGLLVATVVAVAALSQVRGNAPAIAGLILVYLFCVLIAYNGLLLVAERGFIGLSTGSVFALGAVGLTLVYGILKLVNFAHGDLLTFGAYAAYVAYVFWSLPFFVAVIFAMALTALLGIGLEKGMWAPMRRRGAGLLQFILMSIGLAFVIRYGIQFFYSTDLRTYGISRSGSVGFLEDWFGITLGTIQGIVLVGGLIILLLTGLMLRYTLLGKRMRALSDDLELAETAGIDTTRVITWTWVLAGTMAGLAGVAAAAITQLQPELGFELLLPIFAAVVLGGIGNAFGALAGGLMLGLVIEWSTLFVASGFKNAIGFLVLIAVLIIRPQGIFGRERSV